MLMGLEAAAASQIHEVMSKAAELTEPFIAYEVVRTLPPGEKLSKLRALFLYRDSPHCIQACVTQTA
jgi:hypothetical protein